MARYDYRCEQCGTFEAVRPIGTAASAELCPSCGRPARRTYAAPALTSPRSPARRAREAAERSAHDPVVTAAPPPRPSTRARPPNPLHAKLPRP